MTAGWSRVASWMLVLGIGLLAAPAAPAQSSSAASDAPVAGALVLNPGDLVRVTVWRKPELSGEFLISADGTLRHPLYRSVRVSGLPLPAVEARLREFLATYEASPQVLVEPLVRVVVGGEVRVPALHTLPPETTIGQAIALSGGAGEQGRLDRVRLVRNGRVETLDLTNPDGVAGRMTVRSGDEIVVGRRRNSFRDVVGPLSSLAAAIAAIATLARQ
jgi:polysaccharide export outer membrane protein